MGTPETELPVKRSRDDDIGPETGIAEYRGSYAAKFFSSTKARYALKIEDALVFVVRSKDSRVRTAAEKVMRLLPDILTRRREHLSEARIEQLVDLLVPDDPFAAVEQKIDEENARQRALFVEEIPCLTSKDIHRLAGMSGRNVSQTASAWKRKRLVFALPFKGRDLYPAFQFQDGRPRPVIKRVLATLPKMSSWQTAFWFVTGNGWLDGASPMDALDEEDSVILAAERERRDIVG